MTRSLPKVASRERRKKVLKSAKGYFGRRSKTIKAARQQVEKAGQYAYRDRRVKKREFRSLWIQRINAGCRLNGIKYGQFIFGMKKAGINIDRKILADIAVQEPLAFTAICEQAKAALPKAA
jgi:large subunit ribosomal protein L20